MTGTVLYRSRDPEGGGPGALFGISADGEQFAITGPTMSERPVGDHERRLSDFAVARVHDPSSDDHAVWLGIRSQAVQNFGHEGIIHPDAEKTRELYDYLRFLYGDDHE